ncbi:calcitonin gene-related peptide type 1 receptor [Biomphalaria glabrata]|nr:hypothetical protein BgiMline_033311 [Biomphalaria glabrata]KAI8741802.1 hypothetical protein BgiBS90_034778 [Biomphalaria glabrata]
MSSAESDTSQSPESKCRKAITQQDLILNAIKALSNHEGSTRDEVAEYLVDRDLMNARIAKALVAKALYKAVDQGIVERPEGTERYIITEKKPTRRRRHSSTREENSEEEAPERKHQRKKPRGDHHRSHKRRRHKKN